MKPIPVLRHVPHETLGTLSDRFTEVGLEYRYVDLFGPLPAAPDLDVPGLVVLGGPMNVDETDKYPHLAAEVDWIRAALERELPILGICLGSQLLAKALGARVYANGVKEIGWYDLELTPAAASDPLFAGCRSPLKVFQWHGDTFDLPPGAVHLAESPACRHQAYRFGACAWGLQFHIEVTRDMVHEWLDEPGNRCELAGLSYIDAQAIRAALAEQMPQMDAAGRIVLSRFADLCKQRAA